MSTQEKTLIADGQRLDVLLPLADETLSRSQASRLIKDGCVTVNGKVETKPSAKPDQGARIVWTVPEVKETDTVAQDIPLEILYEDEHLADVPEIHYHSHPDDVQSADHPSEPSFEERCAYFSAQMIRLTPTEQIVFDAYLEGKTPKDIMQMMNIKETTLKYHNRNIYSKLGVSSRKQMLEIAAALNIKRLPA